MRRAPIAVSMALLIVLAGCSSFKGAGGGSGIDAGDGGAGGVDGGDGGVSAGSGSADAGATSAKGETVGVSVGGAQDANAFRTNVREGYVPQPTDLTYEGLYHDYYFDTNQKRPCEARFCPSYSRAVTRDPISNETEQFLAVGLNSGLTKEDFQRKKLNLIVVLDTSGSMGSPFDEYYYDGGEKKRVENNQRKMDAAADAVATLTRKLNGDDRIGVVTYSNGANRLQSLRSVNETDMDRLRTRVEGIRANGGTNLDAGMRTARAMAEQHAGEEGYATRIVYVTDAQPNLGDTGGASLKSRLQAHASSGIHSTFVGVGVDFNSRLTETVATVRGANYYSVHSPAQFEERMSDGFKYMVTPLAHDLSLSVETDGYEIESVYGSPQDASSGRLIHVTTLFPSRSTGNKSEGSVILLELNRTADAVGEVTLTASYEDPNGTPHETTRTVTFADQSTPYYEGSGVRKAVVLTEYATLMRNWMYHERAGRDGEEPTPDEGIERRQLGRWEQQSVPLRVSAPYDQRIERFETYFRQHKRALGAERMDRDLAILQRLSERGENEGESEEPAAVEPA
ncbi:MAG: VWA domain-containing protein, partial [Haloarculaceae archaeon]